MTQDDILRMAREAGLYEDGKFFVLEHGELIRFYTLVAAAEREACAKVCEGLPWVSGHSLPSNVEMAAAIRARSKK